MSTGEWITCLRLSFLNYKIIICLPVRIIRMLMKWGMWRLPGNTCFEKANIYPHIGKNPREIPRESPAALACTLWSTRGGKKRGGLLQARRLSINWSSCFQYPNSLLCQEQRAPALVGQLINKRPAQSWSVGEDTANIIFSLWVLACSQRRSPGSPVLSHYITEFPPKVIIHLSSRSLVCSLAYRQENHLALLKN